MKRVSLIFFIFFLAVCGFSEEKQLQALKNEEIFILEYDSGNLNVYRTSDNKKELYFNIHTGWGEYQLSRDRQQLIVYSKDANLFCLLDGKAGTFKSLIKTPYNSMSSFDLKYMIWEKENSDYKIRTKMPTIVITDLQNNKDVFEISWEELNQDYKEDYSFGYHFIRSNEPEYDFFVYAKGEGAGNYLGFMKINIANKVIKKFYRNEIPKPDYPPECYGM